MAKGIKAWDGFIVGAVIGFLLCFIPWVQTTIFPMITFIPDSWRAWAVVGEYMTQIFVVLISAILGAIIDKWANG